MFGDAKRIYYFHLRRNSFKHLYIEFCVAYDKIILVRVEFLKSFVRRAFRHALTFEFALFDENPPERRRFIRRWFAPERIA